MGRDEKTVVFQLPTTVSGQLACVSGTVAGRSWDLSAGTFVMGRSDECDLVLAQEQGVSKVHAKIVCENDSYTLVDNESRNGTLVNGAPIQRVRLKDGDEVRICNCVLRFSMRPSTMVTPQPKPPQPAPPPALPAPAPGRDRPEPYLVDDDQTLPAEVTASALVDGDTDAGEPEEDRTLVSQAKKPTTSPYVPWVVAGFFGAVVTLGGTAGVLLSTSPAPEKTDAPLPPPVATVPVEPAPSAPDNVDAGAVEGPVTAQGETPGDAPTAPAQGPGDAPEGQPEKKAPVAGVVDAGVPAVADVLFPATVEEQRVEPVKVRGGGKVRAVSGQDGAGVARGQVLVTIEADNDEALTLRESVKALEVAAAGGDADAAKKLEEAQARLAQIGGSVQTVTAPIGGTLTEFAVEVGDVVTNGQEIGRVLDARPTKHVRVKIDKTLRPKKGQKVELHLATGTAVGTVVQTLKGNVVVVETGDTDPADVESVKF
jgi:biotin carboxyl carrier protein